MALDFYLAASKRDINWHKRIAGIEESFQDSLRGNTDAVSLGARCLYELDPYGDKVLDSYDIEKLMDVCGKLKNHECLYGYGKSMEARENLTKLEAACKKALEDNHCIFIFGD